MNTKMYECNLHMAGELDSKVERDTFKTTNEGFGNF